MQLIITATEGVGLVSHQILIVEDDVKIAASIQTYLTRYAYGVHIVRDFQRVSPATVRANTGYAFLLSTVLLSLYVAPDLIRWWPFTRQGPERSGMADVGEEADKLAEGMDLVLNVARLQDFALDYSHPPG